MRRQIILMCAMAALLAFCVAPTTSWAAGGGGGKGAKLRQAGATIAEKLGLTADQKAAAKQILITAHEKAKGEQDHKAKLAIYKDAVAKIRADVLTDEQRTKLDELKPKIQEWIKEHHLGGRGQQGAKA